MRKRGKWRAKEKKNKSKFDPNLSVTSHPIISPKFLKSYQSKCVGWVGHKTLPHGAPCVRACTPRGNVFRQIETKKKSRLCYVECVYKKFSN